MPIYNTDFTLCFQISLLYIRYNTKNSFYKFADLSWTITVIVSPVSESSVSNSLMKCRTQSNIGIFWKRRRYSLMFNPLKNLKFTCPNFSEVLQDLYQELVWVPEANFDICRIRKVLTCRTYSYRAVEISRQNYPSKYFKQVKFGICMITWTMMGIVFECRRPDFDHCKIRRIPTYGSYLL